MFGRIDSKAPDTNVHLSHAAQYRKNFIRFGSENLIALGHYFEEYITKYGEQPPIRTSCKLFDSWGNWALSFTHVIATNQKYAKCCRDAINAMLDLSSNKPEMTALHVLDAIQKIKYIHNEMQDRKIKGTVYDRIELIIRTYQLPLDKNAFDKEVDSITHCLKHVMEYTNLVKSLIY